MAANLSPSRKHRSGALALASGQYSPSTMTVTQSLLTFLFAAGVLTITPGVDTVIKALDRLTGCVFIVVGARLALARR
ncbi:hypothetical protein [Archangium gephyra]|nr:hypothetical protein [Archangium gephyra]